MLFHGLAIYIYLRKANGTESTYGSILGQEGIWRLMLFPYPWFLVPLSFGTLHICVSRIVNFPKTTTFFWPTKTIRKPSGELPLSSGERCSTANTCILDEGLGFTSSTAGLPDISPGRNEQEYEHAKLNISMPETRKTPQVVRFLILDMKQNQKSLLKH